VTIEKIVLAQRPDGLVAASIDGDPADILTAASQASDWISQADRVEVLGVRSFELLAIRAHIYRAGHAYVVDPRPHARDHDIDSLICEAWSVSPSRRLVRHPINSAAVDGYRVSLAVEEPGAVDVFKLRHPAWPAIEFLNSDEPTGAAAILTHVGDPRLYLDPRKKRLTGSFFREVGLTPSRWISLVGRREIESVDRLLRFWDGCRASFVDRARADGGIFYAARRITAFVMAAWLDAVNPRHPEIGPRSLCFLDEQERQRYLGMLDSQASPV